MNSDGENIVLLVKRRIAGRLGKPRSTGGSINWANIWTVTDNFTGGSHDWTNLWLATGIANSGLGQNCGFVCLFSKIKILYLIFTLILGFGLDSNCYLITSIKHGWMRLNDRVGVYLERRKFYILHQIEDFGRASQWK